ncbi:MAG: hypothetical protein MUF54_19175 [Polyangiaceae bacterium]|nr:hypothetical protein [Polyangiaceae bacterium]
MKAHRADKLPSTQSFDDETIRNRLLIRQRLLDVAPNVFYGFYRHAGVTPDLGQANVGRPCRRIIKRDGANTEAWDFWIAQFADDRLLGILARTGGGRYWRNVDGAAEWDDGVCS